MNFDKLGSKEQFDKCVVKGQPFRVGSLGGGNNDVSIPGVDPFHFTIEWRQAPGDSQGYCYWVVNGREHGPIWVDYRLLKPGDAYACPATIRFAH